MTREQFDHVLRAAAAIAQEDKLIGVGRQAVLLPHPLAPKEVLVSREVDLYPALHPERAELIDGAIDALSSFDETFGSHADGVGPDTAVMPADGINHATLHHLGEVTAISPELHDLAVSKCVPGRDKDADFVRALLRHKIEPTRLLQRIAVLDPARAAIDTMQAWARRRIDGSGRATA
ncbi:MAG TPA: hypothetical protein VFR90_17440 [Methylibium sp.]|uniref:hypothetical protein n=1 Tax=Methylibium sp. TaxID=2067992 RepID=UPI002DB556FF|nr:hypothetical protein [Methylibium sp.]HEU4460908.1 hypothetical protein [Methylibium sp.]